MQILEINGWTIRFPEPFNSQHNQLIEEVKELKLRILAYDFQKHPKVKQLATLRRLYANIIPSDPFAERFSLKGELKNFQRVKGLGLSGRYRLFFKAFKDEQEIFILWLGFPRKDGSKNDCYNVFKKMVRLKDVPSDIETLLKMCEGYSS